MALFWYRRQAKVAKGDFGVAKGKIEDDGDGWQVAEDKRRREFDSIVEFYYYGFFVVVAEKYSHSRYERRCGENAEKRHRREEDEFERSAATATATATRQTSDSAPEETHFELGSCGTDVFDIE